MSVTIAIAAGGTGGHLFPAQALGQELKRRGFVVVLYTDERGKKFESSFPADRVYVAPSATISSLSPLKLMTSLWRLFAGSIKCWRLMGAEKPAVLAAFGGYPTLPPLFAAMVRSVPVLLHEQNAVMGRANRLAAWWAKAIAGSFPELKYLPEGAKGKLHVTGNPVRDAAITASEIPYSTPEADKTFRLLVFGGSQGARAFSDIVPDALVRLDDDLKQRLSLVQQCRPEDMERVQRSYVAVGIDAECKSFFTDMPERIAAAHLVISRSGASTVSEIAAIGRPAILVPFPHAIDQDQKANAQMLGITGGGWVMEQSGLNAEILAKMLTKLMNEPETLEKTAIAAKSAGKPDAVFRLADLVENIMGAGR